MTDLQNAILEASNSDLITVSEASILVSSIYEKSSDSTESIISKIKDSFSKYISNVKSAFSKLKEEMAKDKNRKLLVDKRVFDILDEFEKIHDELKKTDDKKRQKELSKKSKDLSKELRKCKTELYKEGSKVPSGMKVIEASKMLDMIQDVNYKTAIYNGVKSPKNFFIAMAASITMADGISALVTNVQWYAGLTNKMANFILDDSTSQLHNTAMLMNQINMTNMLAIDLANQSSMMAMQQSMQASNIGASLAMSGGMNPGMFGM